MSINGHGRPTENGLIDGSDSDTDAGEATDYYHPISTDSDPDDNNTSSNIHPINGRHVENGLSGLHLSEDSEEEEEESMRRAFTEDEHRRSAPISPENASRIMQAMRGVSFPGVAPDWVNRVPEDMWVDQLSRLRR